MAMTMRDYSEKRDFHRMQVNSEVIITDSLGKEHHGICKDLSGTGMQIQVDTDFPEGSELQTLLPSNNDQFPPFEATVEVLRCHQHGDGFLLGVAIKEVKR
ncbi:PilZ domain-containing protein [Marinobacter sp. BGYM27]|uniref:PilZ domain-containing protein n=1 Tax=unclassified Marinobacter TaxID=83889 RepID=UPI0021A5FF8C|nr:PilZ domain-containing protein [Marinobacter sp. BGYM27]MDG5498776.1 PilZ domain-containing protein [Marinobacter sp. BGYM27]